MDRDAPRDGTRSPREHFRLSLRSRLQDRVMRWMDDLRPATLQAAEGDVLEIGFGTGLNLPHYPSRVKSLTGLDPLDVLPDVARERIAAAPFPFAHHALRADRRLPFEEARFDSVVTTWTLCSIPEPVEALQEMRRVLKPGGRYLFVEHGRSDAPRTCRWQDRLNPVWRRIADGCNINRPIDALVREGGFELADLDRFRGHGPRIVAEMFRGVARRPA